MQRQETEGNIPSTHRPDCQPSFAPSPGPAASPARCPGRSRSETLFTKDTGAQVQKPRLQKTQGRKNATDLCIQIPDLPVGFEVGLFVGHGRR